MMMQLQDALTLADAYRIRRYDQNAVALVALAAEVRRLRLLLMRNDIDVRQSKDA